LLLRGAALASISACFGIGISTRSSVTSPTCEEETNMTRIHKLLGAAAAVLMIVATSTAPAKAQFAGGGEDMMTQMAPMLNMMKAKMGKKRFGMLMQTMGPMMSKMMDGSGGFGGMNFGGLGGMNFGSGGGGASPAYVGTPSIGGDATTTYPGGGLPFVGSGDGFNAGDMMSMIPQLMSLANMGGTGHHRRHVHHKG
jgi:hypothetical protein